MIELEHKVVALLLEAPSNTCNPSLSFLTRHISTISMHLDKIAWHLDILSMELA